MPLPLDLAFALGDCAAVLAAPAPEETTDAAISARLARATCHLRGRPDGDAARAARDELAGLGGALEGYVKLVRARADALLGDPVQDDLAGVTLRGEAGARVALLRALDAGDVDGLLALVDGPIGPDARLEAAALVVGQPRERAILEAAWLDARPGGADARAEARLRELGVDLAPLAGRRLAALQHAHRAEEALALASALPEPTDAAGWTALGRARYDGRDYAGAVAAWAHPLGPPAEAVGPPKALFDYALAHARTGDYATAAVVYRRLVAQHPGTADATFGHFKLGYMAYDAGDCEAAVPLLEEHVARYPQSKHLDEALWWRGRCAQRLGDAEGARSAFARLESLRPQSSLVPGAAYWRLPPGDDVALERFLGRFSTSAYAWFALERLGRTLPPAEPAPPPAWPAALAGSAAVVRAEALLAAGHRQWAADELRSVTPSGKEAELALAAAKLRAGDAKGAQKLACKHAPSPSSGDPVARQLCWPRVEARLVDGARGSVPPSIVYGVMTAESAMDPSVTSAVGARGLMQLMPEVAEGLHQWLAGEGVLHGPFDADDLYVAPYNALLGATELAERAGTLDGLLRPSAIPAVIASYNAGEEPVRRWAAGDGAASDRFVEEIGYVETRGYVKRVLGSAMEWRRVWGDPPAAGSP